MSPLFAKWNAWISRHMFVVVLFALAVGYIVRLPDTPFLRLMVVILFAYMTFITALGTSFRSFLAVLTNPWIPLLILFLVHIVTPFIAWTIGMIFYPADPFTRLGYLIGASIPIGVTSLIWVSLVRGNIAVSLVAVTLDTLIVPVLLPLFFKLLVGKTVHLDYLHMTLELLWMVTLPSLAGMFIHDWTHGRMMNFCKSTGGFSSKAAFFIMIVINASLVAPDITWTWSMLKTTLVTMLVVALSYALGFAGSFLVRGRSRDITLAMIYNTGMRNISFGLVLALAYFPPAAAIPITLFMLYQQPIAAIIPHFFKNDNPSSC